jgi:hypothetical protein
VLLVSDMVRKVWINNGWETIRKLSTRVTPVTEERLSIRESMRLFLSIDRTLSATTGQLGSFETLCRSTINKMKRTADENEVAVVDNTTHISVLDGTSCGSTMGCFAALFLSNTKLSDTEIRDVISGANITQFMNSPNLLLLSMKSSMCKGQQDELCHTVTSSIGSSLSRFVALRNVRKLTELLDRLHTAEEFPIVMFCTMSWAFPVIHNTHELLVNPQVDHIGMDQAGYDENNKQRIGDHVFTLIKHSNVHFQMVQGYIEQNYYSTDLCSDVHSPSMDLSGWRRTHSAYASHAGFSLQSVQNICVSLNRFANDSYFDSNGHNSIFGVKPQGNRQLYWPSFNFIELGDHHIDGCGERSLIEEMHKTVSVGPH